MIRHLMLRRRVARREVADPVLSIIGASLHSSASQHLRRTAARQAKSKQAELNVEEEEEESYPPPNSSFYTSTDHAGASSSRSSRPPAMSPSSSSSSSFPMLGASSPSAVSTFGAPASLLSRYTSTPLTNLSLKALLALSPSTSEPPPQSQVHESALFTSRELPIRLARRVAAFRALPFIVGANPHIGRVARLYAESFETLANWQERLLKGGQGEEEGFVESLRELVERHRDNVPTLARGFLECAGYMNPPAISSFLDAAINERIGIRLIAEQHLALASSYFRSEPRHYSTSSHMEDSLAELVSPGTIHTALSPNNVLRHVGTLVGDLCQSAMGTAPQLLIEGHKSATYVGVPVHLEYVLTEMLKNSFRASVEMREKTGEREVRPVKVTIAKSERHVSMRIRDRGGGIHPKDLSQVFSYAFSTAGRSPKQHGPDDPAGQSSGQGAATEEEAGPYGMQATPGAGADPTIEGLTSPSASNLTTGAGTLAGLGYGLPVARHYATWFRRGAELSIVSLYGEGCDAFVKMPVVPW